MKILVADDSKTNLALISNYLQKLGHEVIAANDGQEAIALFQESDPDLIILDVVMERMDGFECAKRIRALPREDWIPIIFLSASVDDDSIAKGIDAGGDDYLTKPFSEITLAAKIKAMQRISNMRKDLFEATKKLARLSSTDTLTNIYNRLQFDKVIKEKIGEANRNHQSFALLFLDLDKFKETNDSLGHHIGDLLLIEVSQRLQSCLRVNDFLARMGGDEFAIILSNVADKQTVNVVAEKIIHSLAMPYNLEGHTIHSSSSIGIVFYPGDGVDQGSLTINADIAMYHAKNIGRNNYQYFQKSFAEEGISPETPPQQSQTSSSPYEEENTMKLIHCLVQQTHICINLQQVEKNLPLPALETLPDSPDYLIGLMNLKGQSIPIIDLSLRLKLQRTEAYSIETPILLCSDRNHRAGFIVDKILSLHEVNKKDLQTEHYRQKNSLFLASITLNSHLSLLVNMPYLLTELGFG